MSSQSLAAEQLLELLMHLKRTTPAAARQILNGQPQIAYALITLMVSMNAVDVDVCKKILADYAASAVPAVVATGGVPAPTPPPVAVTPHPAVPPYLQQQQSSTPPGYRTHTPPTVPVAATPPIAPAGYQQYAGGYQQPPPSGPGGYGGYNQYQQQPPSHGHGGYASVPPGYPPYGGAPPAAAPPAAPTVPASVADALAAIPEEQKALIMRVISMTPEQVNALPPQERSMYTQIRATLGIPTS